MTTGPRNAVTAGDGHRIYKWGDEEFLSVTTALSAISKPALTGWAARSVAEFVAKNLDTVNDLASRDTFAAIDLMKGSPWRQRDQAADLGKAVHAVIEAHVLDKPVPETALLIRPHMQQFARFCEDFRPRWLMSEATVYSRQYGYAGTLDAIAELDGVTWLLDVKSGKDVYPEAALQLAMLRYAEFVGMPDGTEAPLPPIDRAGVLHVTADDYRLLPVRADEENHRVGLFALQVKRWLDDGAKSCIGAPAPVPREGVRA